MFALPQAYLHHGLGTLPAHIFQGSAPALRMITLHCVNPAWSCKLFRGLTQLHVNNRPYSYSNSVRTVGPDGAHRALVPVAWDDISPAEALPPSANTYIEMLGALAEMSVLEILFLSHCFPPLPSPAPVVPAISLSRLHSLTCEDDSFTPMAHVLNNITVPAACNVLLGGDHPDPDDFAPMTPFIEKRISTPSCEHANRLHLFQSRLGNQSLG